MVRRGVIPDGTISLVFVNTEKQINNKDNTMNGLKSLTISNSDKNKVIFENRLSDNYIRRHPQSKTSCCLGYKWFEQTCS